MSEKVLGPKKMLGPNLLAAMSRSRSDVVTKQECFKGVSRLFQGFFIFKGVLRAFQGCYKNVSRVLKEFFKGVLRVFQGCFKRVSRLFRECFKGF